MSSRIALRSLAAAGLAALFTVTAASAAGAVTMSPPEDAGSLENRIELPDGFQPEGIAIDGRGIAYFGSLADGDIYAADVRTGAGSVISEGPGTSAVGVKVDQRGRLFVAGGPSGTARVVETETGDTLATYQLSAGPSFVNDVVLTRTGAWFTDSQNAQLYRIPLEGRGDLPDADQIETLPLTGDWVQQPGFNANGIAQTPDRQSLLVIQSSTRTLFRVDPATGEATRVDLGGTELTNGDGLLVVGSTLYVVQNRLNTVAVFHIAADGTSGQLVELLTSPDFSVPTTVAAYADSLYLPNARFGTPPTPDTPYWATRIDR